MNKELIYTLIERARNSYDHAYCPLTSNPEGASVLVEDHEGKTIIIGACNVETTMINIDAGELAMMKALSEGMTKFLAICFFCERGMPYPSGRFLQFAAEFNGMFDIVVANNDTYSLHKLHDLLPIRKIYNEDA